jgi:hypothetical protein
MAFANQLCFEHLPPSVRTHELAQTLAKPSEQRVLNFRGVAFSRSALQTLVEGLKPVKVIAELDLSYAEIPGEFELSGLEITRSLGAQGTRFRELVRLRGLDVQMASFFAASFERLLRIGGVHFRGQTDFRETQFEALYVGVSEQGVIFDQGLDFVGAMFDGVCVFADLSGRGQLLLQQVKLKNADFRRVRVAGDFSLLNAEIRGDLSLIQARVSDRLELDWCQVEGHVSMDGALAGTLSARNAAFASTPDFGNVGVKGWAILDQCTFERPVRLRITAETVHCARANFPAGVSLQLAGDVVLDGSRLGSPSELGQNYAASNDLLEEIDGEPISASEVTVHVPVRVLSMRGADVGGLSLEYVDLGACLFKGAHDLDTLRLGGGVQFQRTPGTPWTTRDSVVEEHLWRTHKTPRLDTTSPNNSLLPGEWLGREELPDWLLGLDAHSAPTNRLPIAPIGFYQASDVAAIYRQLRKAREDAKDSPGAADFYYGEMEMRRRFLSERTNRRRKTLGTQSERTLLFFYWLFSGYGLRAWRPLVFLAVLIVVSAIGFHYLGLASGHRNWWDAALTALNGSTSLLHLQTPAHLTHVGEALELLLRLTGPVLAALLIFALRARVKR